MPAPKKPDLETPAPAAPEQTQQEMFKQLTQLPSALTDAGSYKLTEAVANKYAASNVVPKSFQQNPANCFIAVNIAIRKNMDPIMIMQSMYSVYGQPGWLATFAIACINSCGKFVPGSMDYVVKGEGMTRSCSVTMQSKTTGKTVVGSEVTMQMAKGEGWLDKQGSKWRTMPDHMLRYRAAAFFAREFCPEELIGMPMADELGDIIDVDPKTGEVGPKTGVAGAKEMLSGNAAAG